MALATRRRWRGTRGSESAELPGIVCVEAGHCLLVHVDGLLDPRALAFGRLVPKETGHTVVMIDVPPDSPIELWRAIAGILRRRRGGFRIVLGQHSRGAAVMTGQWLAEHLGRTVLVADGEVVMGAGGTLFCAGATGTGWIRFRLGRPPHRESRRFPNPGWWLPSAETVWQPGPATMVEPLPSGVWIRPLVPAGDQRRTLISSLATRPDAIAVVLGSPRSAPVPLADVLRFTQSVPPEHQDKLRFLQCGPLDSPMPRAEQLPPNAFEPLDVEAEPPGPVLVDGAVVAVIGESWLDSPGATEVARPDTFVNDRPPRNSGATMAGDLSPVELTSLASTAQARLEGVEIGRSHLRAATSQAQTLASSWTGEASRGFQNALANFDEHGDKLLNSLQRMHELVLDTCSQFSGPHKESTDQVRTVTAAWRGLPGL